MKKILITFLLFIFSASLVSGYEMKMYRYSFVSPDCWKGTSNNYLLLFIDDHLMGLQSESNGYDFNVTEDQGVYIAKTTHMDKRLPQISFTFLLKENRKKALGSVTLHSIDKTCRFEGRLEGLVAKGEKE